MLKDYADAETLLAQPGISLSYSVEDLHKICARTQARFKIGATHCPLKRWLGYLDRQGNWVPALCRDFASMSVVPVADNLEAIDGEIDLINKWKSNPLCLNNTKGGENISTEECTSPYFLYVCFHKR